MKKKQLLLAMLLASSVVACSSSDDGDDDAARRAAEEKAAAEKAAAEKAAAEEAARKKKEQDQIAGVKNGNISAGTDAISDEEAAKLTVPGSRPGFLRTSNNKSDFIVNENSSATSDASKALEMTKLGLEPRLDTIVVAYPRNQDSNVLGYMEDFEFKNATANADGTADMENIYIAQATTGGAVRASNPSPATKTETQGGETGLALVYHNGRLNYTQYDKKVASGSEARPLVDSVAEVYGLRTFVADHSVNSLVDEKDAVNLPLVTEVTYPKQASNLVSGTEGVLENVQYGRVTTSLHAAKLDEYKDGVVKDTKVADYGKYGEEQTENVYFYRGLNNTTGQQLAAVKAGGGKLVYQGHAVSYGLDDSYTGGDPKVDRPNAIGSNGNYEFKSGNHVSATLDLATNKLSDGEIYNVWVNQFNPDDELPAALVKFNGTLDNMGNITGTATRLTHSSANEGTLNATLFGDKAQELGGMVSSVDQTAANKWGAVFGAQANKVSTPTTGPSTPSNPWAAATDENDNGKVN